MGTSGSLRTFAAALFSHSLPSSRAAVACGWTWHPLRHFSYGQPVPETHPELLHEDELTVGIPAEEYWERRQRLAQLMAPGSIAVLPSASTTYMAGIVPYPYRPEPDFAYCTGILQHAVAVLQAGNSREDECRLVLFIDPPNPEKDRWDGTRLDKDAAARIFGADEVHYTSELPGRLARLCMSALPQGAVYFDVDRSSSFLHQTLHTVISQTLASASASGGRSRWPASSAASAATPDKLLLLRPLLHELRLVKSGAEAERMRRAAQAASAGLRDCIRGTQPGGTEWQLAAAFEYRCKMLGAQRMSYPPVVASGPDAYFTHYGRNDKVLKAGQLVLMDAGCEMHGYVSDVTRTWPINGKFSEPQRDVYDIVLDVHKRCVEACRPGSSIRDLHHLSTKLIAQGIKDLGLCGSSSLEEISMSQYRNFYWHSVGHWLGMDTHDTALISHSRQLRPGNIITIEPGLYIPDEERYGAFRGIGVRIEDDVLLVEGGCDVLSRDVPTARDEIEAMVGTQPLLA